VQPGAGYGLRRRATAPSPSVAVDGEPWDRVTVPNAGVHPFAAEVAAYGPVVVGESPPELRAAVIDRLRAVLVRHGEL